MENPLDILDDNSDVEREQKREEENKFVDQKKDEIVDEEEDEIEDEEEEEYKEESRDIVEALFEDDHDSGQ